MKHSYTLPILIFLDEKTPTQKKTCKENEIYWNLKFDTSKAIYLGSI